jgi:hypothetical protein
MVRGLALATIVGVLFASTAYADDPQKQLEPPKDPLVRAAWCASLPEETRRQTDACKTQEERDEDAQAKRRKEATEKEKPKKSSFLRNLLFDAAWVPTSGGGQYGLVGTHLDVASIGRIHVFGPPGVLLMMDKSSGEWRVKPALTWGVSIFLTDFEFPGMDGRQAQLFFNLTKAWSAGDVRAGRDLAGLSIAWKKPK